MYNLDNLSIKICDIDLMTVEKSEDYPMFMGYCRFSNCTRTIQEAYLFNDLSQFLIYSSSYFLFNLVNYYLKRGIK